jgi:hypothetical protein
MRRSADVPVGMEGNIHRRLAGPQQKSVGDGLRLVVYASESAPTQHCETNQVPGFTLAFAPC